jgi:SAM-dependent methyltransferase
MGRHYSEDYDRSVASAGKAPNRWRERWLEVSKYKSGGSVLDLGCSNGQFLAGLKGSNWQRYGIEMSETVAKAAAAECGGEVFVGDILDAPYTAESFDLITCFHVFEHLYQPREVLERLSKWLRPGGIFYTMMPNIDSAGARIFGSYWYALELPRHLFHFSPASLKMLAESAGLEEVSIKTKRELFIEASVRYILDEALRRIGIVHTPMAHEKNPSVAFRIIRKAFRLSALPVLNWIAGFAGNGESIHAVFRKSASGAPSTQ